MSQYSDDDKKLGEIKSFYDSVYYKEASQNNKSSNHLKNLAKKLNIKEGNHVLDVACGLGQWLKICTELKAISAGVDISEKAIQICKISNPGAEFYATPAEYLPFANNRFDVVTCLGSLEHFVEPVKALKEMIRVSKKDATFILLVPNADFLTRKLGLFTGTYQVDAKEDVKTLNEWKNLFEEAGLEIEERWKDLHVLSWQWIKIGKWYQIPVRAAQAVLLALWPLHWQYQVYHLCKIKQ